MRLCKPDEVPGVIAGRVCRQSRLTTVVISVLFLVILVGTPSFFIWAIRPALWIMVPALLITGWIAMCLGRRCAKAFRRDNWLLRIAPDGLWINLRSYLNHEFAPAATVVQLGYGEIASVAEQVVLRSEKGNDGTVQWKDRYLDIRLVDTAPPEIAAEIAEERRRRLEQSHLGGLVTSRSRNDHVPVTMPDDRLLRLAWRGRYDFVVPSLATALRELGTYCRVNETEARYLADIDQLTGDEIDRLILETVETGDKFGAVKLLHDRRGYTLTDAHKFVDELTLQL